MKILLLGKNGQVGWELQRSLAPLGPVIALDRSSPTCGDLTDLSGLATTVRAISPDVIINAAAYTAVDRAEREYDLAHKVNALAPGVLAREAARIDALLIHYSTDYVFDGTGSLPRTEDAPTSPLNVYGLTKLLGEEEVKSSSARYVILRTSWVYGALGSNFAKTILRLAEEKEELRVINDQFGAPTGAELIADVTAFILHTSANRSISNGTYHLTAAGEVSWYEYARFIIDYARTNSDRRVTTQLNPTTTNEYPTEALRPLNSRLNTQRLQKTFSLQLPHWQDGVSRLLTEIL
ncbi:dTDP-4-dehydrorhamnose reductase [Pusillimonas noertemannii]|uniref:dTDP-4-dehydrorhamnose reductase n=1 Tax=Pusillimonas noertemannii TaxID=305977 RepID=A0A2U1CPP3_9BURK|nr:dTDP-4-dehydrorhamnose reductase [Pusillimonas noertemannii]NYT67186.1 dTDP-4-dehydrorhamnose reductase [Pusillimonas noertemannii]PVY67863.1 dTDP-4-dehydrorhamnose reductase [Pusillimonas noertemannii]TFL12614.1 dTDP-4-dehydrorhamnose reductase [Pusillimonas noertemannii]